MVVLIASATSLLEPQKTISQRPKFPLGAHPWEQCALHMRNNFFPFPLTSSPTKALSEVLVLGSLLKEQGAERV